MATATPVTKKTIKETKPSRSLNDIVSSIKRSVAEHVKVAFEKHDKENVITKFSLTSMETMGDIIVHILDKITDNLNKEMLDFKKKTIHPQHIKAAIMNMFPLGATVRGMQKFSASLDQCIEKASNWEDMSKKYLEAKKANIAAGKKAIKSQNGILAAHKCFIRPSAVEGYLKLKCGSLRIGGKSAIWTLTFALADFVQLICDQIHDLTHSSDDRTEMLAPRHIAEAIAATPDLKLILGNIVIVNTPLTTDLIPTGSRKRKRRQSAASSKKRKFAGNASYSSASESGSESDASARSYGSYSSVSDSDSE